MCVTFKFDVQNCFPLIEPPITIDSQPMEKPSEGTETPQIVIEAPESAEPSHSNNFKVVSSPEVDELSQLLGAVSLVTPVKPNAPVLKLTTEVQSKDAEVVKDFTDSLPEPLSNDIKPGTEVESGNKETGSADVTEDDEIVFKVDGESCAPCSEEISSKFNDGLSVVNMCEGY